MDVVVTAAAQKKRRVYHRGLCPYAKKIKRYNRKKLSLAEAEKNGYCPCRYCSGLAIEIKNKRQYIPKWEKQYQLTITYWRDTKTLYVQSKAGFWKIIASQEDDVLLVYHRNNFEKGMSFKEAVNGRFHRQKDVKKSSTLDELILYIKEHDRAKLIIMDDYRKLPRKTKKQKRYYRQAARRARRKAHRRVDKMFAMIESGKKPRYFIT